jgi:hypothetical protein
MELYDLTMPRISEWNKARATRVWFGEDDLWVLLGSVDLARKK